MKLYTLTFHYPQNYGAFLQAFALSQKAKATVVDYSPGWCANLSNAVGLNGKRLLPGVWRLLALARLVKLRLRYPYRSKSFPEFERLPRTVNFRSCGAVRCFRFADRSTFIAGSDQIWNPRFIEQQEPLYFLDFGPKDARRISYAASLGMKEWPKPFEEKVLPLLKRFDAISVREESSVPYLTSLGLKNVVCVCDPTLLHTGDFYRKEFPYRPIKEKFSFVYRIREVIPDAVQSILLPQNREIWLSKPWVRRLPSVTEWLQSIDCAEFVVTDSFHCAVFCILFHKPFLVIPNRSTGKGMNERFATLLGRTGLENHILSGEESREEILKKLSPPPNWEHVDAVLKEWRTYSAEWLENALGVCTV